MLYLLLDYIIDEESNTSRRILKIGYSEKKFCESRESHYNTHNYGYKLIDEIEGTKDDEKRLHKKYKHLLLPRSKEWFEYSDDIIDEFYPGFDSEEDTLESISPITMRDLERNYLDDIVNSDYLIGTIKSIYRRIDLTIEAVKYIWKKLLGGDSIEIVENYIEEKIKSTESIIASYKNARDNISKSVSGTLARTFKYMQDIDFYYNYVFVSGEEPDYEVKFNTGRLKIDRLALEAYKNEIKKKEGF